MNLIKVYITLFLAFLISACSQDSNEKIISDKNEIQKNNLKVDHFNIWVEDPNMAQNKLMDIGFRFLPDSLPGIHVGQGTAGKYSNFLNCYLELIYVYDKDELFENNRINDSLDFVLRAENKTNEASPFSIALKLNDYARENIPFKTVKYHQEWMKTNSNIYSAVNSKLNLAEPSIFVIFPEIEARNIENMDSLINIPDELDFLRESFKHPNGAEKISKIVITSKNIDLTTETIQALNQIDLLEIVNGKEHLIELYFDDQKQQKYFDLQPDLPMKIYL